jgi:hypothetical protein
LLNFFAILFLCASILVLIDFSFDANIDSLFLFSWFSIATSLSLIGSIRGLLPFSGVTLIVFLWVSKSIHFNILASPMRTPVSFSSCRSDAVLMFADAIRESISCSVGMNGSFCSFLNFGFSHFAPMNLTYRS